MTPKDFYKIVPMSSVFKKYEHELVAQNILTILYRTGNTWRELSQGEYIKERLKDGDYSNIELSYFKDVLPYTTSVENVRKFSDKWNITL